MQWLAVCMSIAAVVQVACGVAVCPGGGSACNQDSTHRVCAQLLGPSGQPLNWGKGSFWQITGQEAFQWDADIRANHGDSWCICMWATASLIEAVGCENVHLDCAATDVAYVMGQYADGGTDLSPAKSCLQQKCGAGMALQRKDEAAIQISEGAGLRTGSGESTGFTAAKVFAGFALAGLAVLAVLRESAASRQEPAEANVE